MNKFLYWMLFETTNRKHKIIKETKLIRYTIRFKIIPFVLSPILLPIMFIKRYNAIGLMKYEFSRNQNIRNWLSRNEFIETKTGYILEKELYNNNPKYYDSEETNEINIRNEFKDALLGTLKSEGLSNLFKFINVGCSVTTYFSTRYALLEALDPEERKKTLADLAKMNNLEPEEMLKKFSADDEKIKFLIYTVVIRYRFYSTVKNMAISCMLLVVCLLLIYVMYRIAF